MFCILTSWLSNTALNGLKVFSQWKALKNLVDSEGLGGIVFFSFEVEIRTCSEYVHQIGLAMHLWNLCLHFNSTRCVLHATGWLLWHLHHQLVMNSRYLNLAVLCDTPAREKVFPKDCYSQQLEWRVWRISQTIISLSLPVKIQDRNLLGPDYLCT